MDARHVAQKHPKAEIKHNKKNPENIAPLYSRSLSSSQFYLFLSSYANLYPVAVHRTYVISSSSHNHCYHSSSGDCSKAAVKRSNVTGKNHILEEKEQCRSRVKLKSGTTQIQQQEKEHCYCH